MLAIVASVCTKCYLSIEKDGWIRYNLSAPSLSDTRKVNMFVRAEDTDLHGQVFADLKYGILSVLQHAEQKQSRGLDLNI